ncbi:stalk domain-containing protein [Paenibacillus tepidiphilus]|uniref:stalk domain-containing protein n=1 Tax=Paenibacillus tepidiphilus TaxID=2608683 RepID=UPI001239D55F|nr:stalk domain-containing protein [Paenibacillus tepidiphilus]
MEIRRNSTVASAGARRAEHRRFYRAAHLLLAFLLAVMMLPLGNAQAAESAVKRLTLKVGSTAATVNGSKMTIPKPVMRKGVVMVPLGIFGQAFGSTVTLTGTDVVKVMYGPHTGAMMIGSTTAWKDGTKIQLAAPPQMVSDVLMVPLRFVAGVLGARIAPGTNGELVVTLTRQAEEKEPSPAGGGIDSSVGKKRIGNSYYQWSLSYPSELVVGDSGGNESVATFVSAENEYYLEVHASPLETPATAEELLERLVRAAEEAGELVLDREAFPKATVPYARVISKDTSGALWEGRQYAAEGRLYELYLTDDRAVNYKDLTKHAELLDSFRPSFDSEDPGSRDLSTVQDGLREGYNGDYGIGLLVPAEWSMDDLHLNYEGKQGSYLRLRVTSSPAGSTLDSWLAGLDARIKDSYVEGAYRLEHSARVQVSGEPALMREASLNSGNGWGTLTQVLLQKEGYRYFLEYYAAAGREADERYFAKIIESVDIDFTMVTENFGKLPSEDYTALHHATTHKISKAYGYAVDIPRLWTPVQDIFEMTNVEYRFTGGRFQIAVNPESTSEYTVDQLRRLYQNSKNDPAGPNLESVEEATIAGIPATVITVHQQKSGIPLRIWHFVLEYNDRVYTLTLTLNDANATAAQQALVEKVVGSFKVVDAE